jgi:hypothetical protein
MQTMNMAVPLPVGREAALRALAAELAGPRQAEFRAFLERLDTTEERWYLQTIEGKPYCIVYLAAGDIAAAFGRLAASRHPFDIWIKEQNRQIFDIDFDAEMDGPVSENLFEYVVSYEGARQ